MDDSTTRALLDRMVAQAPPPAPVDLGRVIARARAQRRRRATWTIAGAAALVALLAVAVTVLATGIGVDRVAPTASRPPVTDATVGTTPRTAPARFDPARSTLRAAIPGELTDRNTIVRPGSLWIDALGGPGGDVAVAAGAKGQQLQDAKVFAGRPERAGPAIHGQPSRWYDLGHGQWLLRWQWAPDAQALVSLSGTATGALATATGIATSMTVDLSSPTRLPITLRAPTGFTLEGVTTTLSANADPEIIVAYGGGPGPSSISVSVYPLGDGIGTPTTTVQGRPARIVQQSGVRPGDVVATVIMASGDIGVTGTCTYHPGAVMTTAQMNALCAATTAGVRKVADLKTPATWPAFRSS